ncbi:hypothetical protein [Streptomyces sp. NPDC006879]|uniref:hypothetical protein n=1 Tax=Streptomyces sp. NPDC006879 TaxID=3364767 RepID=UPI00369F4C8E
MSVSELTTWAASIGAVGALLLLRRGNTVLTGRDGRMSTSTTLALLWTWIVVWMLGTLLVYAMLVAEDVRYLTGGLSGPEPLDALAPEYLLLLGGPFAALVASKGIVAGRIESGHYTKTGSPGRPQHRQLITNDVGRTDLVDLQYVVFNLLAMAYVVWPFLADVKGGLPAVPPELALLTGGPAAAFVTNKLVAAPVPVITDAVYDPARRTLRAKGGGFRPEGRSCTVSVDGTELPASGDDGCVETLLEQPPTSTTTVVVTTGTGQRSNPQRVRSTAPDPGRTTEPPPPRAEPVSSSPPPPRASAG